MSVPGLVLNQLQSRVGDFTLRATFTVKPGERAVLRGRSGSGKTTLLRMIAGLQPVESGTLRLNGEDLAALPAEKRGIGFVFQDAQIFPGMNVLDNAAFGLRVRGVARAEREARALASLENVGMATLARREVTSLSGGERQRLALVRAMVWQPKLILLDEPFSALDLELRQSLREHLIRLHEQCPTPLILVTHDEADLQRLGHSRLEFRENSREIFRVD